MRMTCPNYEHRKGKFRTDEEFDDNVQEGTDREGRLIRLWADMLVELGFYDDIRYVDHGYDNSGTIHRDKVVRATADFEVTFEGGDGRLLPDGTHRVEVKYDTSPVMANYKAANVSAYIAADAHVLTIFCDDGTETPREWSLMRPDNLRLVQAVPTQTFGPGFMDDKPVHRINRHKFGKYFPWWFDWETGKPTTNYGLWKYPASYRRHYR
jgi:hypothetical protein